MSIYIHSRYTSRAPIFPRLKFRFSTIAAGFNKEWARPIRTKQYGVDVLHDPLWNKSLSFNYSERDRLGLRGLLPPTLRSLQSQVDRCLTHMREQPDAVAKNLYLQSLHNRNETLFHRLLVDHIEEVAPLVYTPTVGVMCQQFGRHYHRARGMYFSVEDRGHFATMMHNWPIDRVDIIVVTDGSRILGLGDLGVHGMGIPIGKLALYCACGGIAPHRVLPIVLDVGTNNDNLLNDPDYIGTRRRRIQGVEYFDFLDEFIEAVFNRWPDVVLQFEDFETTKAVPLLEKYRNTHRVFNDDIQGTGAVTLAGIISAAKLAGKKITDLNILCAGAGSAGLGVCDQIAGGMVAAGLTREQALSRFAVCTVNGILGRPKEDGSSQPLNDSTRPWINNSISDGTSLHEAMNQFKPDVLLGLTASPNVFDENLIRSMAMHQERPIIMPMSNPISRCECTAEQAFAWTDGRAIVATGSPFGTVTLPDGRQFLPSQCNNMYIFPGLGLAASLAGVTRITDQMLFAAAVACASSLNETEIAEGRTFPKIQRIREVSHAVAVAVIQNALDNDLTTRIKEADLRSGLAAFVSRKMYFPEYAPLIAPR